MEREKIHEVNSTQTKMKTVQEKVSPKFESCPKLELYSAFNLPGTN